MAHRYNLRSSPRKAVTFSENDVPMHHPADETNDTLGYDAEHDVLPTPVDWANHIKFNNEAGPSNTQRDDDAESYASTLTSLTSSSDGSNTDTVRGEGEDVAMEEDDDEIIIKVEEEEDEERRIWGGSPPPPAQYFTPNVPFRNPLLPDAPHKNQRNTFPMRYQRQYSGTPTPVAGPSRVPLTQQALASLSSDTVNSFWFSNERRPFLAPTDRPSIAPTERASTAPTERASPFPNVRESPAPVERASPAFERESTAPTERASVERSERSSVAPSDITSDSEPVRSNSREAARREAISNHEAEQTQAHQRHRERMLRNLQALDDDDDDEREVAPIYNARGQNVDVQVRAGARTFVEMEQGSEGTEEMGPLVTRPSYVHRATGHYDNRWFALGDRKGRNGRKFVS